MVSFGGDFSLLAQLVRSSQSAWAERAFMVWIFAFDLDLFSHDLDNRLAVHDFSTLGSLRLITDENYVAVFIPQVVA